MARDHIKKRKLPFHPDDVRQLIKVQRIVQLLQKHLEEECLSLSQIRAADILLRKCVPDLSSTTVSGEVNVRYVVELPPVLTREEWLAKYGGNHLDLPAITSLAGNGQDPH